MPRGDRTGPAGMGPMTGRAAGYCAGYPMPGFLNPQSGRFGGGFGWGRGRWRSSPYTVPYGTPSYGAYPYGVSYNREQEKEILQNQAKGMEDQLKEIQKRIDELEAEATEDTK